MPKSKEPPSSAQTIEAWWDWQEPPTPTPVLKERHIYGTGCDIVRGDHILGGDGLLVCNFPLNRKRWLSFSIYISQWMYCITVLKIWWNNNDWSPFVIWSLFNLFKGFCIQKFTFLCIFFLCKNWCNMCIKHCMYYLYIVWQNDFSFFLLDVLINLAVKYPCFCYNFLCLGIDGSC